MKRGRMMAQLLPFLLMGGSLTKSANEITEGKRINRGGYHTGTAEFHPTKHPIQTYGAQQRAAKKRRKIKAKSKK